MELYKWKSTKNTCNLDIVLAGLMPTSRSEHALLHHFSSSISSWGPHVAPHFLQWPRLNKTGQPVGDWFHDPLDRHSKTCLTSLSLTMFHNSISITVIKYPINRKDWIQLVSKCFDDKTAPKRTSETSVRNQTTAKSTIQYPHAMKGGM